MPTNDEQFSIGEPVSTVPPPKAGAKGSKYATIWAKVEELPEGQWLPVTVETKRMGQRLVELAKYRGLLRKRRELVVYLARKGNGIG